MENLYRTQRFWITSAGMPVRNLSLKDSQEETKVL
jgi:hypothetical protein